MSVIKVDYGELSGGKDSVQLVTMPKSNGLYFYYLIDGEVVEKTNNHSMSLDSLDLEATSTYGTVVNITFKKDGILLDGANLFVNKAAGNSITYNVSGAANTRTLTFVYTSV